MFAFCAKGLSLALPALIEQESDQVMVFRCFDQKQDLVSMGFDTWGPGEHAAIVDPQIILLPLAAFDNQGNRIGYGGGFYDRTLAQMEQRHLVPIRIGVAFDCQEIEKVAAEAHDIRLDAIVTESGLRIYSERT